MEGGQRVGMPALIEWHAVDAAWGGASSMASTSRMRSAFSIAGSTSKKAVPASTTVTPGGSSRREGAGDVHAYSLIAEEEIAHTENQRVHALELGLGVEDGYRFSIGPHDVHGARHAGIEGVAHAEYLDGLRCG